jgi:exopolysaccharide production protein ExoQ
MLVENPKYQLNNLIEPIFTVLSLLQYSQAVVPLLITRGASEGDATSSFNFSLNVLLYFCIYIITSILLIARWKKVLYVLKRDRWIISIIGLAFISILWSNDPARTFSSSIALLGTTLFGLYFATRYSLKEQIKLLAWVYGIAIALSLLFAVLPPHYGIMGGTHAGTFRGIYTHKNTFGKIMVPAGVVFILLTHSMHRYRTLIWAGFAVLVALLLLSQSTGSVSNFLILLGALWSYRTLRWRSQNLFPALLSLGALGGGLIMLFSVEGDRLFNWLGKDPTLTGRTDIWQFILETIAKRPWLGYGFSAFWQGLDGDSAYIWRAARWNVPESHNGLLELGLALGCVGMVIFLFGFWVTLVRAIAAVRASKTPEELWLLLCLTYLVLANLTESSLLVQNNIFWVLYSATAFTVLIPPVPSLPEPEAPNLNGSQLNGSLDPL